ncbi:Hypothetical predicted protein [Scomber scombrus]|uniref:Uncharacterized protein n=1 Tax=Scomber scombrus TaxID=13677 RepID=A0AAV1QGB3_SCOSC
MSSTCRRVSPEAVSSVSEASALTRQMTERLHGRQHAPLRLIWTRRFQANGVGAAGQERWRLKLINSFIFMPAASFEPRQRGSSFSRTEERQRMNKSPTMAYFNTPMNRQWRETLSACYYFYKTGKDLGKNNVSEPSWTPH